MNYELLERMKAAPQWILHGKPGTTGKEAKQPFAPDGGTFSADPSKWVDYNTARINCNRLGYVGVGYEFVRSKGIIGIDLDHHYKDGQPDETMMEFINAIGSAGYWEISPSGEGIHVMLYGQIPNDFNNRPAGVEMYSGQYWDSQQGKYTGTRYLTFTGNALDIDLPDVADPSAALARLHAKYNTATAPAERKTERPNVEYHSGQILTREQARQAIQQAIPPENYLTKAGKGMYICPFCGSGSGGRGSDGALSISDEYPWKWTCFSNKCFGANRAGKPRSGDVIDLYMHENNCDYNKALNDLAESIGVTIQRHNTAEMDFDGAVAAFNDYFDSKDAQTKNVENGQNLNDLDYSNYYRECKERLRDPDSMAYIIGRGISAATADAYNLGYDPHSVMLGEDAARIIIPVTKTHYIGRRTDLTDEHRVLNSKCKECGIFNASALYSSKCVFVTEGPFDALSFIEIGFPAIAVNGSAGIAVLLAQLDRKRTGATLILALDNDDAGKKANDQLRAELTRRNVHYVQYEGARKDPNEYLVFDRDGFATDARAAWNRAERPDSTADYINHGMFAEIEAFQNKISTGWRKLDETANGGLYSGLYVIGAVSSLGKTSFMLQMADQVAAGGTDVIFFSLEQSRLELVSKSLGRYTALLGQDLNQLEIRANSMAHNERSKQAFDKACAEYLKRVGNRMNIVEANFICDALTIGEYVRDYIARTGNKPLVIVDYLQALKPPAVRPDMDEGTKDRIKGLARATAREQVDYSMVTLKQLTRELSIPVVAVCSVSRTNYMVPFDLESLKESGGIEYSADVVWGIQFHCLSDDLFTSEGKISDKRRKLAEEKQRKPRKLDLVCRKNRFGQGSFDLALDYYPANDLFIFPNQFLKAPNFRQHDATGKYNDLDTIMKML